MLAIIAKVLAIARFTNAIIEVGILLCDRRLKPRPADAEGSCSRNVGNIVGACR
jgi:hypothetical protein